MKVWPRAPPMLRHRRDGREAGDFVDERLEVLRPHLEQIDLRVGGVNPPAGANSATER